MHETHRKTGIGSSVHGTITTQRAHVVDHPGAQARTFAHHGRRGCIQGDHHIQLAGDGFDHRSDAFELFGRRYRAGARPGGLATDVDQGGASGNHLGGVAQRGVTGIEAATIGEGIWGDVEDAHDVGLGQIKNPAAARQPGRVLH